MGALLGALAACFSRPLQLCPRHRRPGVSFPVQLPAEARGNLRCVLRKVSFGSVLHVTEGHGGGRVAQQLLQPRNWHARLRIVYAEGVPTIVKLCAVHSGRTTSVTPD